MDRAPTMEKLGKESYKSHQFEQPNQIAGIDKTDRICPDCGKEKSIYMLKCFNCGTKPEQPIDAQKLTKEIIEAEAELRAMGNKPKSEAEQLNTELLIVKTIQGLMSAVNRELGKLDEETEMLSCHRNSLVLKALENIDSFQRGPLNELQKAFE